MCRLLLAVLWTQVSISRPNGFRDIPTQTSCAHRHNAKPPLRDLYPYVKLRLYFIFSPQLCLFTMSLSSGSDDEYGVFVTRRLPPSSTLPDPGADSRKATVSPTRHAPASPLGRQYPVGTVSTSVVLPVRTTSVLPRDHWLAARRPRRLPTPCWAVTRAAGLSGYHPLPSVLGNCNFCKSLNYNHNYN